MKVILKLAEQTDLPIYHDLEAELLELKQKLRDITIQFNIVCINIYYNKTDEQQYNALKKQIETFKDLIHQKEQQIIKKYEKPNYTDKINNALKYSNYEQRDVLINEIIKSYMKTNVI